MNRGRLAAFGLPLVVAGALIAGCGDSEEKNDYVDEVNELQLAYVDDVNQLVSGAPPTSPNELGQVATDLASLTEDLAVDIDSVEPPDEVADLHDQLVGELKGVAAQIEDAEAQISSGNPQEAVKAATELQQATTDARTELDSIISEINSTLQE
jgi:hypothetical protein